MKLAHSVVLSFLACNLAFSQITPEQILVQAATLGDAERVSSALTEVDPNLKDPSGTPVLTLAAKSGNLKAVRALLWAGADPALQDAAGKTPIEHFTPDSYNPIQLLLRCYKYVRENGVQSKDIKRRNLVLVSDNYVDFEHPDLAKNYWKNELELNGKQGVDDDGNGFIDDIYGWNVFTNKPPRKPDFDAHTAVEKAYVTHLLAEISKLTPGNQKPQDAYNVQTKLKNSYTNPLVRSMGFGSLASAGIIMNDLTYASILQNASHGTHVAGLVVEGSQGKALVHTSDWGGFEATGYHFAIDDELKIFNSSNTFEEFTTRYTELFRAACVKNGKRGSAYLKSTGAGIVNMSWSSPNKGVIAVHAAYDRFRERKNFPAELPPIDKLSPQQYDQIFGKPTQEARIAQAAAYALLIYENPGVLFVIAAGNESQNNDSMAPLPGYLSNFFPNVITVASHGPTKTLSPFSNYGASSVQIAAIGENLRSTAMNGNYCYMQGTSMAAPVLAGVCAGIRNDYPLLSPRDIRNILMETSEGEPSMLGKVECGGILNAAAARSLAENKSSANFGSVVKTLDSLPSLGSIPPAVMEFTPRKYSTVAVAGGRFDSKVIMAAADVRSKELIISSGYAFPEKEIKEAWAKNYRITSMGCSSNGHTIAMKTGNHAQSFLAFDQDEIARLQASGNHIKALSGYAGNFSLMMEPDPNIISQRFTMPTPFTKSRQQWVLDRWAEGYTLTAVGGDDDPKNPKNGFVFVMSKTKSPVPPQSFSHAGPWPEKWISEMSAKGYGITSVAGYKGRYIVVMTKGATTDMKFSNEGAAQKQWLMDPK
ncbi:S8 family serine peptidase [Luteolibacter algae]|uniref:S8 family serine peptidase n=1 Tax=Luteolibacter algae TaxID=454151 RepID=A0ABW5D4M5_9BACT